MNTVSSVIVFFTYINFYDVALSNYKVEMHKDLHMYVCHLQFNDLK